MKQSGPNNNTSKDLRGRAEEFLQKTPSAIGKVGTKDLKSVKHLIEDLQIHQVELEMQGEELRRSQQELFDTRDRYLGLYDSAPVGYFSLSSKGIIKEANLTASTLLGIARGDLVEKPLSQFIAWEDQDIFYLYLKELLEKGENHFCELRLKRKEGTRFYARLESTVIITNKDDGKQIRATISNITEMKQLEAQLQQALKMEAMGTLAGGIAHDFNNLLMAIQSRTSIMLMKKDSSHPDIRHLRGIEDDIESAADLTRQLLGFARGGKYEVKPTDLNELIKKQNRMFGRTKKQITINGTYEENLWSVEVDRGQVQQVLLNLYVNAWQAMPAGGDLYIRTQNTTLDENYTKPYQAEPGSYVQISVVDTGVGMDRATRERIFEPFFTTKEKGRGTGLGLASAYGIVKNHGGFINVYSEKGHGSTFNIYLPASEEDVIEEKKSDGDTLRGSETVLFVDDENMIIETAEELFEQLGYKTLVARSGKEAIETYEKNKERIDIVLLDMIMPDMSGSDTYDRMKDIDPKVKVLLSSGYSIKGQATEIMDRGCDGFIQKPFKMKELSQKLREILDEK